MKPQKYLIVATLSAVLLAGAPFAFAKSENHQALVHISSNGKVLLRGTVNYVSATSLMVKSSGNDWAINLSPETKFRPHGSLSDIKAGDFVSVKGTLNQSSSWTIDAKVIRDWSKK